MVDCKSIRHLRKKGALWFFQPSKSMKKAGFSSEALGSDPIYAFSRAEKLNAQWDLEQNPPVQNIVRYARGTIGWLVEMHRKSDKYKNEWSRSARREFDTCMDLLNETKKWAASDIDRKHIRHLYENMIRPTDEKNGLGFSKDKAGRIIKWLRFCLSIAKEEGFVQVNHAFDLKLSKNPPRSVIWNHVEVTALAAKAAEMGRPSIGLSALLAFDLGQRQGDVLRLSWGQFDGSEFLIRQGKTQETVKVRLLSDMRAVLEAEVKKGIQIVISEETGRPYKSDNFQHLFREIADAAGFNGKQFIDLRRSSVVRLSLAGCTPQLIASITGHSIKTVTEILKVYNPPTTEQARQAVVLLEAYMERQKEAANG